MVWEEDVDDVSDRVGPFKDYLVSASGGQILPF